MRLIFIIGIITEFSRLSEGCSKQQHQVNHHKNSFDKTDKQNVVSSKTPETSTYPSLPAYEKSNENSAVPDDDVKTNTCSEDNDDCDDEIGDDLDKEDFSRMCAKIPGPVRSKVYPHVILIGVKKGGTRALIEFLKIHPLIRASGPEIHFFDKHFDKGTNWYVSKMPSVAGGELAIEKTPAYFHTPEAPERVLLSNPNVKLILIVRDPTDRLISDYNQFRSKNLSYGGKYPSLEEFVLHLNGTINEDYPPVQRSLYHIHMKRWLKYFPLNQIHIVHGERFIDEPWNELKKVESFLSLPHLITQDNFFFNDTKGFYCSRESKTNGVWKCTKEKCLSSSKGRPKPPMQPETLAKLRSYFSAQNDIFYEIVHKNFGWT